MQPEGVTASPPTCFRTQGLSGSMAPGWRLGGGRTEVNVQEGRIGAFYQDPLGGAVERLVHEVHAVAHHGSDPLSKALRVRRVRPASQAAMAWDGASHQAPCPGPRLTLSLLSCPSTSTSKVGNMDWCCWARFLNLHE